VILPVSFLFFFALFYVGYLFLNADISGMTETDCNVGYAIEGKEGYQCHRGKRQPVGL
jgi:hypothetical protein